MPAHAPLCHLFNETQASQTSPLFLPDALPIAQTPPSQVSLLVQELLSSHAAPSSSAALPTQVPFWQVSAAVQAVPSSPGGPVGGGGAGGEDKPAPPRGSAPAPRSAPARATVPPVGG